MTHGDNNNCKCPYCRKPNHNIISDLDLARGEIKEFTKPCQHCGKSIFFWARIGVQIDAEQEKKVK